MKATFTASLTNWGLAALLCFLIGASYQLDVTDNSAERAIATDLEDAQRTEAKDLRKWQAAHLMCNDQLDGNAVAVESDDGRIVCKTKRGHTTKVVWL